MKNGKSEEISSSSTLLFLHFPSFYAYKRRNGIKWALGAEEKLRKENEHKHNQIFMNNNIKTTKIFRKKFIY